MKNLNVCEKCKRYYCISGQHRSKSQELHHCHSSFEKYDNIWHTIDKYLREPIKEDCQYKLEHLVMGNQDA